MDAMRIHAFAICYNEEALLPYYLRHYSAFCDKITIYDNQSTDRSVEICKANPKVEVISYDTGNEIRDDIYLQIKNNCWKNCGADWVIVGDIDELVYHPQLREVLGKTIATAFAPALFNMFSKKFPTTDGQIWEEVKRGLQGGAKLNLFRPADIQEINYQPGCHEAHPVGRIVRDDSLNIKTLHMKYLGKEYYMERTRMSNSRLSAVNKRYGWGHHYQKSAEELSRTFDEQYKEAQKVI
jgi:hypothetical protein